MSICLGSGPDSAGRGLIHASVLYERAFGRSARASDASIYVGGPSGRGSSFASGRGDVGSGVRDELNRAFSSRARSAIRSETNDARRRFGLP